MCPLCGGTGGVMDPDLVAVLAVAFSMASATGAVAQYLLSRVRRKDREGSIRVDVRRPGGDVETLEVHSSVESVVRALTELDQELPSMSSGGDQVQEDRLPLAIEPTSEE